MHSRQAIDRRNFLRLTAAAGAHGLLGCSTETNKRGGGIGADAGLGDSGADSFGDAPPADGSGADAEADGSSAADAAADIAAVTSFRFAVLTDTHASDERYVGPESSDLDTESMAFTNQRMDAVIDRINGLKTPVDLVIHVGDLVHRLPQGCPEACGVDFFYENRTRLDIAAEKMARLRAPYQICFGNHDYLFESARREDVHALYAEKLGPQMPAYGAVERNGWKFLTLNSYLGATHASSSQSQIGSCGEEQLQWLEAQLAERKPTLVFIHQMLQIMTVREFGDFGLHELLKQYEDTIAWVVSGHTHRWLSWGRTYGPEHIVFGATRYDEDCFAVGEVDLRSGAATWANESSWEYYSAFANPWEEA